MFPLPQQLRPDRVEHWRWTEFAVDGTGAQLSAERRSQAPQAA